MTSSALLVDPAYANFPAWTETLGPEVADLCEMAGLVPDAEQRLALDAIFALGPDNFNPAAFEFAVICARQNMKTALFQMCALGWLFVTEQKLTVWSAHEMDTTREAFRDITNLIEGCAILAERLLPGPTNGVFHGSGREAIELAPSKACPFGQRLKFKARTKGGGRGLTGDKVVLDEAYELDDETMSALMPTMSTRREGQMLYGSSACHPNSHVLRKIVDRGRSVNLTPRKRLGYLEFCAPEGICEDPECPHTQRHPGCAMDKREYIAMANPQAGHRISWEYLEDERESLTPEKFGRERLGWHDKPAIEDGPLISKDMWAALIDPKSAPSARVAFGVYINKLQTNAAIAVAGLRPDGKVHVGIVPAARGGQTTSQAGIEWIPGRMKKLKDSWKPCAWGFDDRSAAGSLLPAIAELGIAIENTTSADFARACQTFYAKVKGDGLRHQGGKPLADSVTAGRMRDLGDSWVWESRDIKIDIVQLKAVTLAVHALETAPPPTEVWSFYS